MSLQSPKHFVDFGPIERGDIHADREYIPMPGGWEYQTKGSGSSWRLLDKKTGERFNVLPGNPECGGLPSALGKMAREIHAVHACLLDLAQATERYLRAIDDRDGDPKAIRIAVENLRAAHGRYEKAKGDRP